jgi:transcriptional regulator with XRE-family HTH domain
MTIFGEKLKSYVESNGINIYKLAQRSGIERTAIHKIMSAGRIPDVEYVQKLINAMQITPYEREEFWTA